MPRVLKATDQPLFSVCGSVEGTSCSTDEPEQSSNHASHNQFIDLGLCGQFSARTVLVAMLYLKCTQAPKSEPYSLGCTAKGPLRLWI